MSSKTMVHFVQLVSFLLLLCPSSILAIQYKVVNNVPNSPGGRRFDNEIGIPYTLGLMKPMNAFIFNVLRQPSHTQRRKVRILTTNITDLRDGALAETGGDLVDDIYFSAAGINNFPRDVNMLKFEFIGVMYHEMTHIFQWRARGNAPGWLNEGIADYVRVKSGYYHPESYPKPGQGKTYKEGYGVTARFLEYCDSLRDGFTPELNSKMRGVYKEDYFRELLGKPLDQLWAEYKHKYGDMLTSSPTLNNY